MGWGTSTPSMEPARRMPAAWAGPRRPASWWLPLAILCPSLVWLARDRSAWPWDQAWFGAQTLELFEVLSREPLAWPSAMARATPWKPPAVAWIGQFFVPLAPVVGSMNTALLLSVWCCHLAALLLIFRALLHLAGGRVRVAVAGTLLAGAAPIFVGLTTQYLAEAAQTLAVAWLVFVMVRAPQWTRPLLGAHLAAALSFAMLAKATSPLYVTAPALVALAALVRGGTSARLPGEKGTRALWGWWALAILLTGATAVWYGRNLAAVMHHARLAAFGGVAELYGRRETFVEGLGAWCRIAVSVWFLWPVALIVGLLLVLGLAKRAWGRRPVAAPRADVCALAALLQMLAALAAIALSPNRDPRYIAPLLPLAAVILCWAILNAAQEGALLVLVTALAAQLCLVHTQVLGLWPARPRVLRAEVGLDPEIYALHADVRPADDLAAIVHRTCVPGSANASFVGVDLPRLSGHTLTYTAAKERLAGRAGACRYDSVAFSSLEQTHRMVESTEYTYWIAVDPQVRPVPPGLEFVNTSAPVVFRRLRRREVLQPERWNGPPGVLLFRFVRR